MAGDVVGRDLPSIGAATVAAFGTAALAGQIEVDPAVVTGAVELATASAVIATQRLSRIVGWVAPDTGLTLNDLSAWAASSSDHARIFHAVTSAVFRPIDDAELRRIARVLRDAIMDVDDAKVDLHALLAETLPLLTRQQYELLHAAAQKKPPGAEGPATRWTNEQFRAAFPAQDQVLEPNAAALVRFGLLEGAAAFGGATAYSATPFGRAIIDFVECSDEDG